MRSKAPLLLMEQMIMLLVFALAAALCLQAFVKSDEMSRQSEARDQAVILVQSAAETIRAQGGDAESALAAAAEPLGAVYGAYGGEGAPLELHYNEDWTLSDTREYAYALQARPVDSGVEGLAKVSVQVLAAGSGTPLFAIEVAWQEVSSRG